MSQRRGTRLLAIGLDAAEPALIRSLIEQGELPALKSLLAEGRWMSVRSPAYIGSGAVWPTFATGQDPLAHGVHGEWSWQPQAMAVIRYDGSDLRPFWKTLSEQGVSVGVLDPPFIRTVGIDDGFEITEWGPHDALDDRCHAGPAAIADFLAKSKPHPFSLNRHDNASADDPEELENLISSCIKGATLRGRLAETLITRTRPDFALIVFPEIHHGAHYLWHELDSRDGEHATTSLSEICREVDRQLAVLIKTAGRDAAVMVFSLHGMRPTAGVPVFLAALLMEKGFATASGWTDQTWSDRAHSLIAVVKRHSPASLKRLYYKTLPPRTTRYLAQPTMLPAYDWTRTRAFSLPSDQHGWIRLNLRGRESAGIVMPEEYESCCLQLEEMLRGLRTEAGAPLVQNVIRTATNSEEAGSSNLPDLVVHWAEAAFETSSRINGSATKIETISRKFTGQHAPEGFCILRTKSNLNGKSELPAKEMHLLISGILADE